MKDPPELLLFSCCFRLRRRKNSIIARIAIIKAPVPMTPAATIPPFTLFFDFPESSSTTDFVLVAPGEAPAALGSGFIVLEAAGAVVVASELVVVVADEEDPLDELEVEVDDRVTGRNVILVYTICNNTSDGWPVYDNSMLVACSGFPHPHCE